MGKNPWEDPDHEVAALAASMRAKGPKRWLRVLVGIGIVGALTFIAGYYVPLFRAHDELRDEFQRLSEKRRTLEETLQNKERQLAKLDEEKRAVDAKLKEREAAEDAANAELEKLRVSISSKVRPYETKGLAASSVADQRVRISLSNRIIFSPHTLTITQKGSSVLCDVARAAGSAKLRVVSVTSADEPPSAALAAKFSSRRELSGARAAVVTDRLQDTCKVAGGRMEPVGLLEDGDGKGWGVKLPAIVIELTPADGKK